MSSDVAFRIDPRPERRAFDVLYLAAWGTGNVDDPERLWARSLVHIGAFAGAALVGYVNVAGDGGRHAFLVDTMTHPEWRGRGIGTELVRRAIAAARERGAEWLHVDYEPHLDHFYRAAGFLPTSAGLLKLV